MIYNPSRSHAGPNISKSRAQRIEILNLAIQVRSHEQWRTSHDMAHRLSQRPQLLFPRYFPIPHSISQRRRLLGVVQQEQAHAACD